MTTRGYRVTGRVQGVGYRAFTRRAARRLGLAGWVCNRPDGSVEVLAAGPPAALAALERELRAGPAGALVESVAAGETGAEPPPGGDFEIRYV